MRRILHAGLMRGRKAQGAAILLMLGLLATLAISMYHGVRSILS